jgi:hypothetical protein
MTAAQALRRAQKLLAEKGWTQGEMAKDAKGNHSYDYRRATCFCIAGALDKVTGTDRREAYLDAFTALNEAIPPQARRTKHFVKGIEDGLEPVILYNDAPKRTIGQIFKWIENAIGVADAAARQNEQ